MADGDSGGLLVQIGVTQARMERELAKLVKDAAKSAQQAEDAFNKANGGIAAGAQKAFGGVKKGAEQATPAIKGTAGATSNLASQLNDIGVQLAGGQSPFLIMLQQGTQISQLFNQQGGSIRSFGSLLAGAVTSVLNPFSLLTFAIIAAGGTAVQYFASIVGGGEESNKAIEEQQKLITSLAEKWGEAVPALQAYADAIKSASDAADAAAAKEAVRASLVKDTAAQISEAGLQAADLVQKLMAIDQANPAINNLIGSYQTLQESIENGTATNEEFNAVVAAAQSASNTGISGIDAFIATIEALRGSAISTANAVASMNAQISAASNRQLNNPKNWRSAGTNYNGSNPQFTDPDPTLPVDGPKPDSRPLIELEGLPGQYKADGSAGGRKSRGGGGGSKRGANAYKDEVAGIKERTAALRESTAAQASVNPLVSDYGFALEKAKAEQKLLADAQRAGMTITPALKEQISALAGEYASASAESKKLSETQKDAQRAAEEWASLEKDVFKGFITDLKSGKSGAEALSSALDKIADKLLDMAIDGIFSPKNAGGGAGGSGIFGSLLGGIGKVLGFASGTARTPGRRGQPAGIVHGEEAVIPLPAGGKVPVTISQPTVQKGKGSNDVVSLVLRDDSGRMADVADQRIQTASGTIVQFSVEQSFKAVQSSMGSLMTDTQARQF